MIETHDLIAKELLTEFRVIKVYFWEHAVSEWTLQYKDYEPIMFYDKCFITKESDEKLVGRTIKAHIRVDAMSESKEDIGVFNYPHAMKKEFTWDYLNGFYYEDSIEVEPKYNSTIIDSCIDSIFKVQLSENLSELGIKKGDFVKIKTCGQDVILDRRYIPLL